MTAPASQTAPVAEFRCLYTPDIRKKQKKWQDGFLKFHSFNNRVMVYDQARNFLGDTYYKDSDELHEGDELTLDKGVMVEVADAVGVTQTDLKPLFEKKPREGPSPPPPSAPPRRFQPPAQVARRPQPTPATSTARTTAQQLRHKSLNTLLGTPKGPIGKSVPIQSPYEARQDREREKENDFVVDRAAKRHKTTHNATSSATRRLSSPVPQEDRAPKESQPSRVRPPNTGAARKPAKPIPDGVPVITLDEIDAIAQPSSPASLPSTPPTVLEQAATKPAVTPAQPARPAIAAKPALQTPKLPKGKVPVPAVKALETPRAPAPPSSPPVSASNRLTNIDFAIQPTPIKASGRTSPKQHSPPLAVEPSQSPPRNPKAKSLRLSRGVKRGTLLICQQPSPPTLIRSRGSSEARTVITRPSIVTNSNASRRQSPAVASFRDLEGTQNAPTSPRCKRKPTAETNNAIHRAKPQAEEAPDEFDEDPEIMHGLMDQQLLVPAITPPPEPVTISDSSQAVLSRPRAENLAMHNSCRSPSPKVDKSKPATVAALSVEEPTLTRTVSKSAEKSQAVKRRSPAAVVRAEAEAQSRAASPALSAISESRSRTASLSPGKLATLSTGGFRNRKKRATLQTAGAIPDEAAAAPRNETVALPPHPLRANKRGPVMTTTELAAMLQQPKKRPKVPADPIEDGGDAVGTSPNRKFRRVRSENDAPIPSTSEDWEERNLPRGAPLPTDLEPSVAAAAPEPPAVAVRKKSGLAALIKKTDPRKKFVRTQSLTVETAITPAQEVDSPMVSPVVDKDIGPWSTEAFDLFDWRPPGREDLGTQGPAT